ncbi:hypothetical protein [Agrococcus jejuensis]|uniref:Uncharacterized protein n=1 Tax=Agrococcus jejuensis TaxID=399736 RepID=A0A1G8DQ98_9MICO|nr:hypothetical protein [Agrococcus jejuensis]SDH59838.1 hypothetical protein SAMN04489720_1736 [Agrococcus jejuensis]
MSWMRRYERRELHRSRSLSSSLALIVSAIVLVCGSLVAILGPLGLLPSGITGEGVGTFLVSAGAASIGTGVGVMVVGLVWLVLGLSAGRRSRRALERDGVVLIVDDSTFASALSGTAARAARVGSGAASTVLGRRRAATTLRPDAGFEADVDAARAAATSTIDALRPKRGLRADVKASIS